MDKFFKKITLLAIDTDDQASVNDLLDSEKDLHQAKRDMEEVRQNPRFKADQRSRQNNEPNNTSMVNKPAMAAKSEG